MFYQFDEKKMGDNTGGARTRNRILTAAMRAFTERGFDGTSIAEIARRVGVSKQLVHHHFQNKERLFKEVHDHKFRPILQWQEALPKDPTNVIAQRFLRRAKNSEYTRFLTWEAAARRPRIPGIDTRRRRLNDWGADIRRWQEEGKIRKDMDYRLVQLAIQALATYPLAFNQMTLLITGCRAGDQRFQRDWYQFLTQLGQELFRIPATTEGRSR